MLDDLIFDKFGIRHLVTAAYHPQTNGQDERTNCTLKRHLSKVQCSLKFIIFMSAVLKPVLYVT